MKHLCIFIFSFVIYYNAFFPLTISEVKREITEVNNKSSKLKSDTNELGEINLISLDSNLIIPENEFITPKDTNNLTQPVITNPINDTIGLIQNEQMLLSDDSTGLIQKEIPNILDDSTKLIQNESLITPGDTIKVLQQDSLNINKNLQKDTIPRIQFRSVYVDSIEQGNPNFFTKKVIEIKWISEKRDTVIRYKNIIGFNAFYGVYTYGIGFGIFKRLSNDADFIANINLSYVFDRRSTEDIDSNTIINALDRESRLYPIVFNVGLEKYFMQNRIDWKVKPVLIFGFAPAVILVTPHQLTFFKSLKKIQLSYGIGVFAALGFDWQAFNKFGINLTARYSFIPVIGNEIYYYKGFLVKNVGGFYVNIGVTLLKEYFSKK
ncbi:MAG: hypothetical protein WC358_09920 [Ignavibacteria bacterium]|jgi:hypothetical protein